MTCNSCTLKTLPGHLNIAAANEAARVNPVNRPHPAVSATLAPEHLALITARYWGAGGVKLGVTFLDVSDSTLRNKILAHMNAWGTYCNAVFSLSSQGEVRISTGPGGYYSYLGTDILQVPGNQQTMNLERFSLGTPESEYHRVVRHETGHTLGFPHEHLRRELVSRLDPEATISYFGQTQGWSRQEVIQQVLTPLEEGAIMATGHADEDSIMAYQLPSSITIDGQPIRGGTDIDPADQGFAAQVYPLAVQPPPPPPTGSVTVPAAMHLLLPAGTYALVKD